jgi:hypothetical protein
MDILTVARRANFGASITSLLENAKTKLLAGASYSKSVRAAVSMDEAQREFHDFTYLTGIVSLVEGVVTDLTMEFLIQYPGHLKSKGLSLDIVSEAGSIGATIELLAEKSANELSYGKFVDHIDYVVNLYNKGFKFDADVLADTAEIKATRDLFVHSGGKVNKIYIGKAGAKARSKSIGSTLQLGDTYIGHAEQTIRGFLDQLNLLIPEKTKRMGKATTLRQMWDATTLARHVPFDKGWTVENEDMVRPNDDGLGWLWSGSEKMLVDFFLGIYSEDYPGRRHDVMSALRKWPPATNEGKVMMSWFDSPFWF